MIIFFINTPILIFILACFNIAFSSDAIIRAHSHNDYKNETPLYNALDQKFKSIEVDIFLSKSNLYVGHHWLDLNKDRTIEKMYLKPLWKIYLDNDKSIYSGSTLYLLVDIKTSALKTYKLLENILNKYKPMLTHVSLDSLYIGPVTIILSGNRPPINHIDNYQYRNVFIDGRINDIGRKISSKIMPLISSNWKDSFEWNGQGKIPENEKKILQELVIKVHNEKKEIRFWGSPDNQNTWEVLFSAGVDLINTDNIKECRNFIIQQNKY